MKPGPSARLHAVPHERRGAALLLSFLVLLVIIAIVFQINISTKTDARVARNDITLTRMDLAIESAMLEVFEMLAEDGAGSQEGDLGPPGEEGEPGSGAEGGAQAGEPGAPGGGSVDSRMDDWGRPQATGINDLSLRVVVQDEDSKYNLLNMLSEDEEVAEAAFERVVRILDACREGTREDIDAGTAEAMASAALEHFRRRTQSLLPKPELLSDDEDDADFGLPLTLRELVVLEPFEERHFQDYFDADGERVHSIGSFLTVWTAPMLGSDLGGAAGGRAVNVNTAPIAVLASLVDSRDVPRTLWDDVRDYRNEAEEPEDGEEEVEPMLDEFGNEIVPTKVFDDLGELDELYSWRGMSPEIKAEIEPLLTVESNVFSVFVTARVSTEDELNRVASFESRREQEEYERSGAHLVRTVRAVVWRRAGDDEVEIVPLLRWEVLDYAPLEVLDYRDEI